MVEAEVSICRLRVVLADGSVAVTSFREERVLVVVGETAPRKATS